MPPESTTALVRVDDSVMKMALKVDAIAAEAIAIVQRAGSGSFAAEIALAYAVRAMQHALTNEVMEPVLYLQNTDLGFRTDKKEGYAADVVRDCLIEAKLRGYHVIGNEFNIIAAKFYAAKNGLRRRVTTWPGLTDLKESYGEPTIGASWATVPCKAEWKLGGVPDVIEAPIPVRINKDMGPKDMGPDALIGRAERKLFKRIHDRLSGVPTPEGEVDATDVEFTAEPPLVAPPVPPRPAPKSAPADKRNGSGPAPAADPKRDAEDEAAIEKIGAAVAPSVAAANVDAPATEPHRHSTPAPTSEKPPASTTQSSGPAPARRDIAPDAPAGRPIDEHILAMYEIVKRKAELGTEETQRQLNAAAAAIAPAVKAGKVTAQERAIAVSELTFLRNVVANGLDLDAELARREAAEAAK